MFSLFGGSEQPLWEGAPSSLPRSDGGREAVQESTLNGGGPLTQSGSGTHSSSCFVCENGVVHFECKAVGVGFF